jgi:hypothetical protein
MAKVLTQKTSGRQKNRIDGVGQYDWEEMGESPGPGAARVPIGTEYEFKVPGGGGALDPAKLLTEIALDGLDQDTYSLPAGTTDGQEKQIITSFGGNNAPVIVTGDFRHQAALDFGQITFNDGNQGVLLFWSTAINKWCIRRIWGPSSTAPVPDVLGGPP